MISRRQIIESAHGKQTTSVDNFRPNKRLAALANGKRVDEYDVRATTSGHQRAKDFKFFKSRKQFEVDDSPRVNEDYEDYREEQTNLTEDYDELQVIDNQHEDEEQEENRLPLRNNIMTRAKSKSKMTNSNYQETSHEEFGARLESSKNFDPYSVYGEEDEEEDVWYSEERLFEDHIQEIVDKWRSIDDEIWAKIICMERNRRIAKAYARKHTITVNGSQEDYLDGTTLGLNAFDNPDRDSKTSYLKQYIGEGVKVKIQHNGDIFLKRLSRSGVFVHPYRATNSRIVASKTSASDLYALNGGGEFYAARRKQWNSTAGSFMKSTHIITSCDYSSGSSVGGQAVGQRLPQSGQAQANALQPNRVVRIFNMAAFKAALEYESRQTIPARVRLQNMCISIISFVQDDPKMLNLPAWIMIINIVALDLLSRELGLMGRHEMATQLRPRQYKVNDNETVQGDDDDEDDDDDLQSDLYQLRHFNGLASKSKLRLESNNNKGNRFLLKSQFPAGATAEAKADQLTGSSSSGFNSNCSFEDEQLSSSSPVSESLPEDTPSRESGGVLKEPVKKPSQLKQMLAKEISEPEVAPTSGNLRGQRAPKLPHGISGIAQQQLPVEDTANHQSIMSEPIAIPAPPTSAGGPSGRANLILVSPTGLSPPVVKRNSTQEFASIKHIDAQGNCQVLINKREKQQSAPKRPPRLPTAIPAHAQLAPPATRSHILRYLLSTAHLTTGPNPQPPPPPPPLPPGVPRRLNRPLPGLPLSNNRRLQPKSDESLYYSGLQARVPNYPPTHHQVPLPPHGLSMLPPATPFTKSAIDALLTDFKQSAHFRQQQQRLLMANMRSNSISHLAAASVNYHTSQQNKSNATSGAINNNSSQLLTSSGKSLDSLNDRNSATSRQVKPLATLFTQMGAFLKRSKNSSKSAVELKSADL